MFEWLKGADIKEYSGDPIANAFASGQHTETYEGEVPKYDDHPVRVKKWWKQEGDEETWVVKIWVPDGPDRREVTEYFSNQFTAEAVLEKLVRDYELEKVQLQSNEED